MAYKRISPQPVTEGGTGAQTFTAHGVLIGEGTSAITPTAVGTTGQVLTGVTGADPVWASPAASSITLTADTGGGLTGNSFTIAGGTSARDINTSGSGSTIHIDLNNAITLGDLSAIGSGSNALSATTGDINIAAGNLKLPTTSTTKGIILINGIRILHSFGSPSNIFVGYNAGNLTASGANNSAVGSMSLIHLTSGNSNAALGNSALGGITSGGTNTGIGSSAASTITTGTFNTAVGALSVGGTTASYNIGIGYRAGNNYTSSESSNIVIASDPANTGTIGESHVIRIGSNGSGNGQQNACFIAGIDGVNVGSTATVVTEASNQLGTSVLTAGSGISITPGANTITIATTGSGSGALVLIQTQTATLATSLSFTTGIIPTYNNYVLYMTGFSDLATAGTAHFVMQISTDGGATWISTGYFSSEIGMNLFDSFTSTQSSGCCIFQIYNLTSGLGYIVTPTATLTTSTIYDSSITTITTLSNSWGNDGYTTPATVANAIRILTDDISVFSGVFSLYGYSQ